MVFPLRRARGQRFRLITLTREPTLTSDSLAEPPERMIGDPRLRQRSPGTQRIQERYGVTTSRASQIRARPPAATPDGPVLRPLPASLEKVERCSARFINFRPHRHSLEYYPENFPRDAPTSLRHHPPGHFEMASVESLRFPWIPLLIMVAAAQPSAPTPPHQQNVDASPQEVKKVTPGAPFKPSQSVACRCRLALVNTVGVMRDLTYRVTPAEQGNPYRSPQG